MSVPCSELTASQFFPFYCLLVCFKPFLEFFSSKKFSRVVVYCSVIKVPAVLFSGSSDILSNPFRFVKNFFIFLFCPIRSLSQLLFATAYVYYHIGSALSTTFFSCFSALFPPGDSPPRPRSGNLLFFKRCPQRQVLSYHGRKELSIFFLFFIYFRQFAQFRFFALFRILILIDLCCRKRSTIPLLFPETAPQNRIAASPLRKYFQ